MNSAEATARLHMLELGFDELASERARLASLAWILLRELKRDEECAHDLLALAETIARGLDADGPLGSVRRFVLEQEHALRKRMEGKA